MRSSFLPPTSESSVLPIERLPKQSETLHGSLRIQPERDLLIEIFIRDDERERVEVVVRERPFEALPGQDQVIAIHCHDDLAISVALVRPGVRRELARRFRIAMALRLAFALRLCRLVI